MAASHSSHRMIGLRSYLHFLRPYRLKIFFVLGIFVISNGLLAIIPVFIGKLVGALSVEAVDAQQAWLYAWILVGLSSFHDLTWRGAEFAYRAYINEISYRYETLLFSNVISRPYPYFVDKMTGKIGSYITQISQEFRNLLDNVLFGVTGQAVGLIATIFILGSLNWQTLTVFLVGISLMYLVGRHTLAYNMKYEAIATDVASTKNGKLFDAIANYPSIKSFHSVPKEIKTIADEHQKAIDANQKAFFTGIVFWGSMSLFIRHFIWGTIILMNVWFFFNDNLSLGQLATMLSTVLLFSAGIWELVWYISQFGQKFAQINEAHTYLFGENVAQPIELPSKADTTFRHHISLLNLSFAYPDKRDVLVLDDITIDIRRGEKVGIVGHSGSGKSTLTKLLLDLYRMPAGCLLIDGKGARSDELASLISFVPQDTSLFHRSIADNIAYGADDASMEAIVSAAKQASADEFIVTLPEGYDTMIGERGVKLSGGQRQRVAIARAILQQKPILVLDEATSALDSISERKIQAALNNLWQEKTVIAIAHRLSTLRHMDKIIVMDNGRIVEQGSHDELLAANGMYTTLWSHQSGGFIED